MSRDWTIDTCVLYKAADEDFNAFAFLFKVFNERHWVTFDHEGLIEKEYRRCLKRVRTKAGYILLKEMFENIVAKLAQKFSGKLQRRHRKNLRKLSFDASDWPFVAVCAQTQSKNLVSEDYSDYTEEVKKYLKENMNGICVLCIKDCLNM